MFFKFVVLIPHKSAHIFMCNSRTDKINLCLKRRKRRKTIGGRGKGEEKQSHLGKRID